MLNNQMNGDIEYNDLIKQYAGSICEIGNILNHRLISRVMSVISSYRDNILDYVFKFFYGKGILRGKHNANSELYSGYFKKAEARLKERDKQISHVAGEAKEFDDFMFEGQIK